MEDGIEEQHANEILYTWNRTKSCNVLVNKKVSIKLEGEEIIKIIKKKESIKLKGERGD